MRVRWRLVLRPPIARLAASSASAATRARSRSAGSMRMVTRSFPRLRGKRVPHTHVSFSSSRRLQNSTRGRPGLHYGFWQVTTVKPAGVSDVCSNTEPQSGSIEASDAHAPLDSRNVMGREYTIITKSHAVRKRGDCSTSRRRARLRLPRS